MRVDHFLGRPTRGVGALDHQIEVRDHHLLADLFHRPVVADRSHLDGLLVLGARDIGERNIRRQMIEPSCLADLVRT